MNRSALAGLIRRGLVILRPSSGQRPASLLPTAYVWSATGGAAQLPHSNAAPIRSASPPPARRRTAQIGHVGRFPRSASPDPRGLTPAASGTSSQPTEGLPHQQSWPVTRSLVSGSPRRTTSTPISIPTRSSSSTRAFGAEALVEDDEEELTIQQDEGLERAVRTAIERERRNYSTPLLRRRGPPEPFELEDVPGSGLVTLQRSYGREVVRVCCSLEEPNRVKPVSAQPAGFGFPGEEEGLEEEEEEERGRLGHGREVMSATLFTVTVANRWDPDGPSLEFHCSTRGSRLTIDSVLICQRRQDQDDAEDSGHRHVPYPAPDFSSLDARLQGGFYKYLSDRGVDDDTCSFLVGILKDKERREYMRWLEHVERFLLIGEGDNSAVPDQHSAQWPGPGSECYQVD